MKDMNKKEETPFLEVNNLTVEYFNKTQVVHAVSDISFQLQKGKTLGLVGETGAGKTSIAKAILRILPDVGARIPKGEVMLNGVQISSIPEKKMQEIRGNEISMIFQDPMTALNPVQRVGDQIAEEMCIRDRYVRADWSSYSSRRYRYYNEFFEETDESVHS